jgi:uncharacterized membrane protein
MRNILLRSAGIGALAAMRTFAPPLWLARTGKISTKNFFRAAAVFETVFDKMPFVGNRTAPPQLLGRMLSGAACAAYVARDERKRSRRIASGAAGALAAGAATYGLFHFRKWVGGRLKVRDGFVGAVEDAASLGLGRFLAR